MALESQTNPDIRPVQPLPAPWEKLEWWHKFLLAAGVIVVSVFGAGAGFTHWRATFVSAELQRAVDEAQDTQIRALVDDSGKMHVTMDDLHDEVRGMRTDLRFFDPRIRGGNLPPLPEEAPRSNDLGLPMPLPTPMKGRP